MHLQAKDHLPRHRTLSCFAALLLSCVGSVAHAQGGPATVRSLDEFLEAQGATSQFVPPVGDYVGWVDADVATFALIDYAGLANDYVETESGGTISLGTKVNGTVIERPQADGRAKVRVRLATRNALAWAFSVADADFENDPLPFLNTPLSFGARAQDVLSGAEPSLGVAILDVSFFNSSPGAPLPDLVQTLNAPTPEQVPWSLSFRALAPGTASDGELAILEVRQVCNGDVDPDSGDPIIICDTEILNIRSPGGAE